MADHEEKALKLMAEAEKKKKSTSGFLGSLFGSGSGKLDEACELYTRAANSFKMAKKWAAAGNAFCESAVIQLRAGTKHEAATNYCDAATCYRKADPNEAVHCLIKAIEIYTDMGRFTIAAKHHITVAEIYESEVQDIPKALQNYEQAADFYKGEESNSSANKCMLKVAQYAAQTEDYEKAIEIYEQIASKEVASSAMNNQLLKYGAKDHFFRAVLCRMCRDLDDAAVGLQRYEEMFPVFADARECKLVKTLLQACEDQDIEAYTEAVREYDSISRLDQWYTAMLLKIKKNISEEPDNM